MAEWAPSRAPVATGARRADSGWPRSGWFDAGAPSVVAPAHAVPAWPGAPTTDRSGFVRLWKAFMSARLLLALALLALQLSANALAQPVPAWVFWLTGAYAVLTALERWRATPQGPGRSFDGQWFYTAGADLLFVAVLMTQEIAAGIRYTPLLALPVLMTAILGTRTLALGTAALAALLMLGNAVIGARAGLWASTAEVAQAGLMGCGLLAAAWLTNTLALRLAREQQLTARGRAEVRMQSLVNNLVIESMADGVLVVDAGCVVHAANPAAHGMLGSDLEVTPGVFRLTDHPAWVQLADLVRLTFEGQDVDGIEIILHHEDQAASQLKVRTERTPSLGAEHEARLCVMFLQDLRGMQAQLRTEKLASMGRMSAAVAHEFRNPLAAISQANALLAEELAEPAQQRLTDMIRQNTGRLAHIVDDVLDVARAPGLADETEGLVLNDETQDFCNEWAAQHGAGARLQVQLLAPDLAVHFAREHLRRLLVNLLDNAARYASTQPGAIQVTTQAIRHGPVLLRVWSDGAPLDPVVQRHLFEPFSSSESRSSGLGLFICRELCERHGAVLAHQRTVRERAGEAVEGNAFGIEMRRAPGRFGPSSFGESSFS